MTSVSFLLINLPFFSVITTFDIHFHSHNPCLEWPSSGMLIVTRVTRTSIKIGMDPDVPEGWANPAPLVAPVVLI